MVLIAIVATAGCGLVGTVTPGGSTGGSGSPGGQPASSSQLSASSTSVSFGSVTVGTPAVQSVIFTNAGTEDVIITDASATGTGFSASSESNVTLTPNQSVTVSVKFDPSGTGSAKGTLSVTSNASNATMDIPLTGTGVVPPPSSSQLSPSSTSVSFGNVTDGTPTVQPVILTDLGTGDVIISAVSVTGTGFSSSGGVNVTLTPNTAATVSVTFNPTGTGSVQGTLSITSNATNSVLKISLSGTGVAKTAPSSQLTANSASVSFGNVTVGTPAGQSVVLTDSGTANVAISAVSATGSGFSASGGTNVTLAPNKTITINVSFDPTGQGSVKGNLAISSNASNSVLNIPLSGTGTTAPAVQRSVALNWQPSVSQVIGYFVYRGTSASGLTKLILSSIPSTSYTDSTVANGQTYYYAVTAIDSSNVESGPTSAISVTIPAQ